MSQSTKGAEKYVVAFLNNPEHDEAKIGFAFFMRTSTHGKVVSTAAISGRRRFDTKEAAETIAAMTGGAVMTDSEAIETSKRMAAAAGYQNAYPSNAEATRNDHA